VGSISNHPWSVIVFRGLIIFGVGLISTCGVLHAQTSSPTLEETMNYLIARLDLDGTAVNYSSMSHDRCRFSVTMNAGTPDAAAWTIPFDELDPDSVVATNTGVDVVEVKTTNEQPAIGVLDRGQQRALRRVSFGFKDAATAKRVAQALRTAISLCGGIPSKKLDFEPK
jgi:hypothetical protein